MASHVHATAVIYRIACIPGDGVGPEVVEAGVRVLNTLSSTLGTFGLHFTTFDWGATCLFSEGECMPSNGPDELKDYDAIYFGIVGQHGVPDEFLLTSLILPIRKSLDHHVNVRPKRILPGTTSPLIGCIPTNLDWIIIRENSEGDYSAQGGVLHEDGPHAVATEVSIFTKVGTERVMRYAFEIARSRPRKKLTMVTKMNVHNHGMALWDKVFDEVAKEYEDVQSDIMLVEAMPTRMTLYPSAFDTIVATNLHANILSNLAAALSGSTGITPSCHLDPSRKNPSLFAPTHGCAPGNAGRGIANPIGAIWSAAEMVRWIDEDKAADVLIKAIENVTGRGIKTTDLGGNETTEGVTDAMCAEVERLLKA
ncbi:hypothetical protein COCC4DRAFT_151992 [Bipolaris maydis ATCC 48331]|uniref:Isopropylmalate dehydrogenase-like domain-containing protein n=2 Tax=Cochliobolus heterostrophus TaxID=5016 RepID=M2UJI2_COCH5|nr:uncharacterized protein COCC4DRAFT_151992 [Bipolaris maydis ATCC 48331]EMD93806.1 hypothetical protein COCHEDRAFT_1171966 [Bipolaris maydis C5]KAH7562698.1 hypothetical protein BM1_02218 [Bipolaris maydis]ENH99898.1 hypothetical protein COCC4DRAFT_151992 [Bipolaris maydis ATCC 48331]KAJ5028082.1 hypothetical protein J3E73DRAFT_380600 [Bipolaris maydis]KAJ5062854.1 tartrate dehydrogenase/decarboxylase [Bipolaris maydis]